MTAQSVMTDVRLHVPEEPAHRRRWRAEVLEGAELSAVIVGQGGPAVWLWDRWRVLARAGLAQPQFVDLVDGYRRELWLWMAGDRTWEQCCAGLIGRIERRLPA